MIRKYNYTGRRKIPKKRIVVRKHSNANNHYFSANIDIDDLAFPPSAKVYVEAVFKTNNLRFDFGNVGNIQYPSDTLLDELPNIDDVLFHLKVVDETETQGKILGISKNIHPETEASEGRKDSLLPVKFQDIGSQVWKIDFDNGVAGPVLVLNIERKIPGIKSKISSDPFFISLIYPTAIRFVFSVMIKDNRLDKSADDWTGNWLIFAEDVLGAMSPPEHNTPEIENWLDDVVNSFCQKYNVLNRINFI